MQYIILIYMWGSFPYVSLSCLLFSVSALGAHGSRLGVQGVRSLGLLVLGLRGLGVQGLGSFPFLHHEVRGVLLHLFFCEAPNLQA